MDLDLAELREMHPKMLESLASLMVERAALALERNQHRARVSLTLDLERELGSATLS